MFVCTNTARRSLLAAVVVCLNSAVAVAQEPGTTLLEGIIIEAGNLALEPTRAEQLGSACLLVIEVSKLFKISYCAVWLDPVELL